MPSLFVNNLSVIDFAYFCPRNGIVGESLILDVELFGDLNDEGMLFDFSFVKKRIKSCVDDLVDHKLLVATKNEFSSIKQTHDDLALSLRLDNETVIYHNSPNQAVCLIDASEINSESIKQLIQNEVAKILPSNVSSTKIGLRIETIDGPYFHYAHGLKKHFGDCQRIAHGHRSKIEVFLNNQFSLEWSKHIAELWKNIYLATEEDIKSESENNGVKYWTFEYSANQGLFQLTIPQAMCHLIESDTTVELIASYLANYLKSKIDNQTIKVVAYEGVDKGSICEID